MDGLNLGIFHNVSPTFVEYDPDTLLVDSSMTLDRTSSFRKAWQYYSNTYNSWRKGKGFEFCVSSSEPSGTRYDNTAVVPR
jgi:hypothetical protein